MNSMITYSRGLHLYRPILFNEFWVAFSVETEWVQTRTHTTNYLLAEQGDHAHEFVITVYSATICSFAALFSERVGMNARM